MGDEDIEAKGDSIERLKHLLTSGKLLYTSTKKYAAGGTTTGAAGGGSDVKSERFLPGRMCYVYNLKDGEVEESEEVEASTTMTTTSSMFDFRTRKGIPTTVYRSKAEYLQPRFKYVMRLEEDLPIIERLSGVLGYMRTGTTSSMTPNPHVGHETKKDKRKQSKQQQHDRSLNKETETVVEEDMEDDIFADVGTDFNAEEKEGAENEEKKNEQSLLQVTRDDDVRRNTYFGKELTGTTSTSTAGAAAAEQRSAGSSKLAATATYTYKDLEDEEDENLREVKAKKHDTLGDEGNWHRIMKSGEQDAYADLYPGYDTGMYHDDDDGDNGDDDGKDATTAGVMGNDSNDLKGAKVEGRGGKGRGQNKDANKLNMQYTKMKQLFKDKGFGNEEAFEDERQEDDVSNTNKNKKKKKNKKNAPEATFQPRQKRLRL